MRYEQVKLAEAAEHFQRLAVIVDDVRRARDLLALDGGASLAGYARRGDTAALAWDGAQLVGVSCLGLCHHFVAGPQWLPIKVHLMRAGYDLSRLGCSHFVYLSPDYWGAGATAALTQTARRSNPQVSHTLSHSFATPALEAWAAGLPGMVELGLKAPDGGRVFVWACE